MSEEMYWFIMRIFRGNFKRCNNFLCQQVFQYVLSMLEYAYKGDIERLRESDYYHDGEPWLKDSNG